MPETEQSGMTIKARLNLKIDPELKDWAKEYARRHGTDVTKLITEYFLYLRRQEAEQEYVDQI
jgi:hypothetical protein